MKYINNCYNNNFDRHDGTRFIIYIYFKGIVSGDLRRSYNAELFRDQD